MLFIFDEICKQRNKKLQYISIKNLSESVGKEITLRGWLYNKRSSGKVKFIILRDGTGLIAVCLF